MSMGPLGMIGSAAGSPLPQTSEAEKGRQAQDTDNQARQTQSAQKSEAASGIGQTEEHEHADDRDADGRRLWEDTRQESEDEDTDQSAKHPAPDATHVSKDATGQRGKQLDLSG